MTPRKPNYRQEKKARERARDLRQTEKQSRRQAADSGAKDSKNPAASTGELPADEVERT